MSATETCVSVPEIRVLGMGIGLFLYILLFLLSISVVLATEDTGTRRSVGLKMSGVNVVFLALLLALPKKGGEEECGPPTNSQGLLQSVVLGILGGSVIAAYLGWIKVYFGRHVLAVTREDRATGLTTAEGSVQLLGA